MPYTLQPDHGYGLEVEEHSHARPSAGAGGMVTIDSDNPDYLRNHVQLPDRWVLNIGPQHPATHTTLRLIMELDGERVARVTPHIGYLHSGFEKLGEHHDYNQYVCTISRMDYISPIVNDIAFHTGVERFFGIEPTTRCKVVRTIMAELGRIQNHLLCVGAAALDLGGFTGFLYGFNEREFIYDIVEYLSGQRFHPDWTRVGGAWRDIPCDDTFKRMIKHFINERLPRAVKDMETLLTRNRIFNDRLEGVGAISKQDAIAWGLTGPMARSAGVRRDLRKDEPVLCYADNWDGEGAEAPKFDVVVCQTGDCFARYLVRVEEIKQSARIINQLIDRIPTGPFNPTDAAKITQPDKANIYGSIEGVIENFELMMWNKGWKVPIGEGYFPFESPNGELGYFIVGDGTKYPWRVRTRPPCFVNYAVLPKLVEGHLVSDAIAVIGSINVIAAELDR